MGGKKLLAASALALAAAASGCAFLHGPRRPLGPDRAQPSREFFDRGDYGTAIRMVNELFLKERLTENEQQRAWWTLCQSYDRTGQLDKALSAYQVAVQLFPKNKGLTLALAKLLHRTELDAQARPYFERVLQMDPRNSEAHLGLAESFRTLGLLDEAAGHYRVALEGKVPDPASAWRDYAGTLAEEREPAAAEEAIGRAVALSPSAENLAARALIERSLGRGEQAYASLDGALKLEPLRRDLVLRKAFWLLKDARLEEAEALARRLGESDPSAAFVLGVAALKRGDRAAAAERLREAQAGSPLTAEASAGLLKALGGNP